MFWSHGAMRPHLTIHTRKSGDLEPPKGARIFGKVVIKSSPVCICDLQCDFDAISREKRALPYPARMPCVKHRVDWKEDYQGSRRLLNGKNKPSLSVLYGSFAGLVAVFHDLGLVPRSPFSLIVETFLSVYLWIWVGFSTKAAALQSSKPDERPWFLFV